MIMSKRDLKKYLSELSKTQLEEQFIEMYDKFANVKVYYNFVFNPNEKNLIKDARLKSLMNIFLSMANDQKCDDQWLKNSSNILYH